MCGMIGHGDAFVLRDPAGIRPAFFYADDEVVMAASERPVIQTAFNVPADRIQEVKPGHALIIKKDGSYSMVPIIAPLEKRACSFERIYFSRGNDQDIYQERMALGKKLCPTILRALKNDIDNTVFSFIPNTAEVSFYGMVALERCLLMYLLPTGTSNLMVAKPAPSCPLLCCFSISRHILFMP